jgi:hypothetical protein
MVVPVLVFVPPGLPVPRGWFEYDTAGLHEPPWWNRPPAPSAAVPSPKERAGRRPAETPRRSPQPGGDALFSVGEAMAAGPGLGMRIVESDLFAEQKRFVRKAPPDEIVAALIDGLHDAGGRLPTAATAALVGQPPFRMAGYLSTVGRLLNIDGYQVIAETDGGRTVQLDARLLREQFLEGG